MSVKRLFFTTQQQTTKNTDNETTDTAPNINTLEQKMAGGDDRLRGVAVAVAVAVGETNCGVSVSYMCFILIYWQYENPEPLGVHVLHSPPLQSLGEIHTYESQLQVGKLHLLHSWFGQLRALPYAPHVSRYGLEHSEIGNTPDSALIDTSNKYSDRPEP